MTNWLGISREALEMALAALALILVLDLLGLVLWRVVDEIRFIRRQRLIARYRPVVDLLLTASSATAVERLLQAPARHRGMIGDVILAAVRPQTGDVIPRMREAAEALGLLDGWRRSIDDRRWWMRTAGIRAIGLLRDQAGVNKLLAAMDDEHEEVRAAAVDALGRIADPRCATALLSRLHDQSRHQRARLVEAIRNLGPSIMPVLLDHARGRSADTAMIVDLIGMIGGANAIDSLLEWSGSDDPVVRIAALRAIGSIGLDDRSFYFALRGLSDEQADARAMAARALGRSGRQTAVPYLAAHLDDEWLVAAHCATGLRRLGQAGSAALESRAASTGQGADLARQMLWELTFLKAAV